jgi:short-subunit dehydrogenase
VQACVDRVTGVAGRIDVVVNNAGVGLLGAIEETSLEEARRLYETNVFGAARVVAAVLPGMRQRRRGLIINFGSLAATLPIPFHAYLSSSKAAIGSYTDALCLESRPFGIWVSLVEPGMIATHQGERFAALRAGQLIDDYADPQARALAVIERGQQAGSPPELVAETVLGIIKSNRPAAHYLFGPEKWYARASRLLPPSAVERLVARCFHLNGKR